MIRAVIAACLLLASCATPGTAKDESAATGEAASATAKPAPKLVCRRESLTGSHMTTRVCRPAEESSREQDATQVQLLRPSVAPPRKE